jgi:hypothetical protein
LTKTFGTIPEDLVGLLAGDWLKAIRIRNLARIFDQTRKILRTRGIDVLEPASPCISVPIMISAADESRDELQDIWARLLAAAADPARAKSFRSAFIEAAKKMDPLDAAVLQAAQSSGTPISGEFENACAAQLHVTRDEVSVSVANLQKLEMAFQINTIAKGITPFGREFLCTVSD